MSVNACPRIHLCAHTNPADRPTRPRRNGDRSSCGLPAGRLGLAALRVRLPGGGDDLAASSGLAPAQSVSLVCRGRDAPRYFRGQRARRNPAAAGARVGVAEHAIEHRDRRWSCGSANTPRTIASGKCRPRGNRFAGDRVGVAEVPKRQRWPSGAAASCSLMRTSSRSQNSYRSPRPSACWRVRTTACTGVTNMRRSVPWAYACRSMNRNGSNMVMPVLRVGEAIHEPGQLEPGTPCTAAQSAAEQVPDPAQPPQRFLLAAEQAHARIIERRRHAIAAGRCRGRPSGPRGRGPGGACR